MNRLYVGLVLVGMAMSPPVFAAAGTAISSCSSPYEATATNDAIAIGCSSSAGGQHSVAIGPGAKANVIDSVALGIDAQANAINSVALGRNSTANTQTGSSYLTNVDANAANGVVAVGKVGGERRITNIADGAQDSDAVSVNQLKILNNTLGGSISSLAGTINTLGGAISNLGNQTASNSTSITKNNARIDNIANGRAGLVQKNATTNDISIANDTGGNKLKISGINGDRVLTGVANGVDINDSANIGQLTMLNDSFNDNMKALGYKIDDVEARANAGIAATLSLESAPYIQGKFTYAIGAGFYGGENAIGASLRHTSDNGRWSLNGGIAAASKGGASVRVGISGIIN